MLLCLAVDVTSFRKCHAEACKQLEALCDTWEEKMIEIKLPMSNEEEGKSKSNFQDIKATGRYFRLFLLNLFFQC